MIRIKCRRNSVKMYVKSHKLIIPLEKFSSKLKKFSKSRDTKIRLSKLDDEIFNGVSSLNNKIEKLSAEISLLDSHLSYLKENSIKKTDREWTRVKKFETEILNFESHTHKDSTSKNDIKAAENKISLLREEVSQVKAYLGYKAEVVFVGISHSTKKSRSRDIPKIKNLESRG